MVKALAFCGPNGSSQWSEGQIFLAHFQMHSTPESLLEVQPRAADDLVLVADVRLDNRKELSNILGCESTEPDDIYLLRAYRRWGVNCTTHLVGDFAFAVWDLKNRTLFCARDHLGVSPLYYHYGNQRLVFASDIRGVLAHPEVPQDYDLEYLSHYLTSRYYRRTKATFFRGIRKLPPGHCLLFSSDKFRCWRYWDPREIEPLQLKSMSDYKAQMRELLERAVTDRLRGQGQFGAHLSGGMDSSVVAILAARALKKRGQNLPAFSWSPPPPGPLAESDERYRIMAICAREQIHCTYSMRYAHEERQVLWRDIAREPVVMMHMEGHVQNAAQTQGVRIMLSGWGGDEFATLNGRGVLAEHFLRGRWLTVLRECKLTGARAETAWWKIFLSFVVKPLLPDPIFRHRFGPNPTKNSYLHPDLERYRPPPLMVREVVGHRQNMMALIELGHLNTRMESWAASGAEKGIIYRYPLLDRRLVDFCFAAPPHMFRHKGYSRYLYRRAVEGIMPDQLEWGFVKREQSVFRRRRHPKDRGPIDYLKEVERRARNHPFVDGARLLADRDRPEERGDFRDRALECLFLKL